MSDRGHPQDWVTEACAELGVGIVMQRCADLLDGADPDEIDLDLDLLGGAGSARLVHESEAAEYWPRVWAARAFRYAWEEGTPATAAAESALVTALADEHWRVREMSAKVVALREIGAAADSLAPLTDDGVPRVRAAALVALGVVGEHEHLDLVARGQDDPDDAVGRAAQQAEATLRERLDLR